MPTGGNLGSVKDIWIYVRPIRPSNRISLNSDCTKKRRIRLQGFKNRPPKLVFQIEDALGVVVESKPQNESFKRLHFGHANDCGEWLHGNGSILARGIRFLARAQFSLSSRR